MFWRQKKKASTGPPVVGCFGKLPATGDFIRHNAGGDEVAAWDRWLGASMDFAQRSLGPSFDGAYPPAVGLFVLRGDTRGDELPSRGMVGAWAASGDNAGRRYPMTVFASYDYGQLCAAGGALPIALWPFLTAAYETATAGRSWTVDGFIEAVSRIPAPSLDDAESAARSYRQWLGNNSMKALWETGFGSDASRFWVLSSLLESVEPFRGNEMPQTGLALRLPLGHGDAFAVAVWLDLVLRLTGCKQTLFNTFWTPRQTVLIHLGAPHVATLRELLSPTGAAEHVAELCGLPTVDEETARKRLKKQHEQIVGRTDQSIAQFLDALG